MVASRGPVVAGRGSMVAGRRRSMVPCRSTRIVEIGGSPVRVNWKTTHSVAQSLAHEQGAFRACERCNFFVRARRDLLRARLDLLRANVKSGTAFRFLGATLHRAGRLLHRRSVSSVSLAGQWSRAGRGSTVAGQWSGQWLLFAVRGSRVAVPSLGRHTIVARNVCYADVRVVWHVFHVASDHRF
jgi:hypothetical protein